MVAGKVYHWKHGWIRLDHPAALKLQGSTDTKKQKVSKLPMKTDVDDVFGGRGYDGQAPYKLTYVVDGDPDVWVDEYHESPNGHDRPAIQDDPNLLAVHLTNGQKTELANDVQSFLDDFPGLKKRRKQRIYGVDSDGDFMGETDSGPEETHAVAIDHVVWNAKKINEELTDGKEKHFGIPNQTNTPEEYRKRVVVHEMFHVLHMTSEDDTGVDHFVDMEAAKSFPNADVNPLNALADEMVTPRELGYTDVAPGTGPKLKEQLLSQRMPRWMADSLNRQSVYAVGQNRYEWLAEAMGDGYWNGDKASPAGKRAIEIARSLYGKAD